MRPPRPLVVAGLIVIAAVAVAWPDRREPVAPTSEPRALPRAATPASSPPGASGARAAAPGDAAAVPRTDPNQDPQDSDPRLAARLRRPLERRPAFQGLPFSGDGVAIDFVGADRRGRVELVIEHTGGRPAARRAYRRFLAYWDDDGRGYVVRYRRALRDAAEPGLPGERRDGGGAERLDRR